MLSDYAARNLSQTFTTDLVVLQDQELAESMQSPATTNCTNAKEDLMAARSEPVGPTLYACSASLGK